MDWFDYQWPVPLPTTKNIGSSCGLESECGSRDNIISIEKQFTIYNPIAKWKHHLLIRNLLFCALSTH